MSINEINEQAKESLKKYFKDSQDIQHDDDTKKQLTIEEMYQSVDDEIKEQEKKLEELHQMRHALQHNAKEAYEAVYGKTDEAAEVKHTTVEEMEKELHENVEHQMEYVNELKNKSLKNFVNSLFILVSLFLGNIYKPLFVKHIQKASFFVYIVRGKGRRLCSWNSFLHYFLSSGFSLPFLY